MRTRLPQKCRQIEDADPALRVPIKFYIQLNSCNSNSYSWNNHINRTNSAVLSEFTLKSL